MRISVIILGLVIFIAGYKYAHMADVERENQESLRREQQEKEELRKQLDQKNESLNAHVAQLRNQIQEVQSTLEKRKRDKENLEVLLRSDRGTVNRALESYKWDLKRTKDDLAQVERDLRNLKGQNKSYQDQKRVYNSQASLDDEKKDLEFSQQLAVLNDQKRKAQATLHDLKRPPRYLQDYVAIKQAEQNLNDIQYKIDSLKGQMDAFRLNVKQRKVGEQANETSESQQFRTSEAGLLWRQKSDKEEIADLEQKIKSSSQENQNDQVVKLRLQDELRQKTAEIIALTERLKQLQSQQAAELTSIGNPNKF